MERQFRHDHETFKELGDALRSIHGVVELSTIGDRTAQLIGKTENMSNIIEGKFKQVDELIMQL